MLITQRRWIDLAERWAAWLLAGGRSPQTVRLRLHYVGMLAGHHYTRLPESLDGDDLAAFLARPDWAPETRKSARASCCSFYGWMRSTGRIPRDPSTGLPKVRVPRAVPRPVPVTAFADAIRASDPRTRLILQLGRFAGLRRAEVAQLHTRDIGADGWVTVHGKGGNVRRVPLHPVIADQLRGVSPPGWVFPSPSGGHLTPGHVGVLASAALPDGWTLHTCRHRAGTDWYAIGRDIRAVQELLGHASVRTTQTYVQVPDQALVTAVMGVA